MDRICNRCGQILNKWTTTCPDCGAVQSTVKQSQVVVRRNKSDDSILINKYRPSKNFERDSQNVIQPAKFVQSRTVGEKGSTRLGFLFGFLFPWFFTVIVLFVLKTISKQSSVKVNRDMLSYFRKGMIRGMVIMQFIVPFAFFLLGLLLESL